MVNLDFNSETIFFNGQEVGKFYLTDRGKFLVLNQIRINPDFRGSGYAQETMEQIINYANERGKILALTPSSDFGANKNKLINWYKSLGFIMNKGRNKDYETMELMFREPKKEIDENLDEIIRREIWTMNEDNLEEDYPVSFNMDEFKGLTSFAARKRYADEHLEKIASGSGRHVYAVDDKMALKLAANQKGLAQNAEETSVSTQGWNDDVITKVIDSHPNDLWIESERAKKVGKNRFKELTGYRVEDVGAFLKLYDHKANGRGQYYGAELDKSIEEDMWENEFTSSLGEMIANFAQSAGDLDRISSYGEVNRDGQPQIVVIDYGLSHDVYNTYYNKSRQREGIENKEDSINEVQFQMQDFLDNAAEDANIKDGGYGGNAFTSSNELVGDDLNEYAYEDYRDISSEDLKQSTDFIEAHGNIYKPTGEMVSKLLKNYLIGSQNIENSLKISNNNVKFFNNLMKIQKFFKRVGLIKEDLVYWGVDGSADSESDKYKLGGQGINEDGTSLYTNAQGTVNAEDDIWDLNEMFLDITANIITERITSWMPKSKAVTIKKECQLGGNGNGTSKACNQGDINNVVLTDINDDNQHRRKANTTNVAEDDVKERHYFQDIDRKINETINDLTESIINRKEKDEIFDYSSIINDAWSDPIKQGQEFYKVNFDLENNDSTKQKKTFYFNKDLRKNQPIKYEINAELWEAGGDWEYPVMYFKVEITHDYGLKLSDKEKEAKKEPEYPWDIKGNLAWNHKYVMIPPVEAGNKYTEGESDSGKYKYFAWQDESINDVGIDEKDIKITDADKKSAWKWLEDTFEKAVNDRHKMLDESIFLIKNIINEEIITKQRLKEIAEDHNTNTVLKVAQEAGLNIIDQNGKKYISC